MQYLLSEEEYKGMKTKGEFEKLQIIHNQKIIAHDLLHEAILCLPQEMLDKVHTEIVRLRKEKDITVVKIP